MSNEGQTLSAFLAWAITVMLFISALVVVYQRRNVSWQAMTVFLAGSVLLALAGALAATNAAAEPAAQLPDPWLAVMVVCRAASASISLGLLIMLTDRPRWLVRRARKWLARQGRIS